MARAASGFRWFPKHGAARTPAENLAQYVWRHRIVLYIAFVVTWILVLELTGWRTG